VKSARRVRWRMRAPFHATSNRAAQASTPPNCARPTYGATAARLAHQCNVVLIERARAAVKTAARLGRAGDAAHRCAEIVCDSGADRSNAPLRAHARAVARHSTRAAMPARSPAVDGVFAAASPRETARRDRRSACANETRARVVAAHRSLAASSRRCRCRDAPVASARFRCGSRTELAFRLGRLRRVVTLDGNSVPHNVLRTVSPFFPMSRFMPHRLAFRANRYGRTLTLASDSASSRATTRLGFSHRQGASHRRRTMGRAAGADRGSSRKTGI